MTFFFFGRMGERRRIERKLRINKKMGQENEVRDQTESSKPTKMKLAVIEALFVNRSDVIEEGKYRGRW